MRRVRADFRCLITTLLPTVVLPSPEDLLHTLEVRRHILHTVLDRLSEVQVVVMTSTVAMLPALMVVLPVRTAARQTSTVVLPISMVVLPAHTVARPVHPAHTVTLDLLLLMVQIPMPAVKETTVVSGSSQQWAPWANSQAAAVLVTVQAEAAKSEACSANLALEEEAVTVAAAAMQERSEDLLA